MRLGQGVVLFELFLHPSGPTRATKGSCCRGRAVHPAYTLPAQLGEHRERNRTPRPVPLGQKHRRQTLSYTLASATAWTLTRKKHRRRQDGFLTFPPCNTHTLRAPTGRLIYQNKHTKKGQVVCPHIRNKLFNLPA